MRSNLRGLLLGGALPGALIFLLLYLLFLLLNLQVQFFGQEASFIMEVVTQRYKRALALGLLRLTLLHLLLGASLGMLIRLTVQGLRGSPPKKRSVAVGVLLLHLLLLARHIHHFPQLYVESLYARAGALASLQRFLTHQLPAWALDLSLLLLLLPLLAALLKLKRMSSAHRRRALVSLGILFALGGGLYLWAQHPGSKASGRFNIIILGADSLRPDHMGSYGYQRPTSPAIDALAARSILFERAYVPIARTFPSWASILTGQWPHKHGIRHMLPLPERRLQEAQTLPRLLKAAGYRSAAVADYAGDIFGRLHAGFERVDAPEMHFRSLIRLRLLQMQPSLLIYLENPLGRALFPEMSGMVEYAQSGPTMDRLLQEIDRGDGRPFFISAFFSSPHFPYTTEAPFYRLFAQADYEGESLYMRHVKLNEDQETLRQEMPHIRDLFDGGVRAFDHQVARLLAHLEKRDLMKETILVILSDHGESLGERGILGHGDNLRNLEELRIPLIIYVPGLEPQRVPGLVRSVDLAPSLLQLLSLPIPKEIDGRELGPMLRGEQQELGLLGFAETGIWFSEEGGSFYQRQRIPYPGISEVAELGEGDEICIRPAYEDVAMVAKHRAAFNLEHEVIYLPSPEGLRYEGWNIKGAGESLAEEPDLQLKAALKRFISQGDIRWLGPFALPHKPKVQP